MAQETCGQQELTEQELSEVAGGGILSAVKGLFKGGKAAKQGAEAAKKRDELQANCRRGRSRSGSNRGGQ